jgi:hypothetical protein
MREAGAFEGEGADGGDLAKDPNGRNGTEGSAYDGGVVVWHIYFGGHTLIQNCKLSDDLEIIKVAKPRYFQFFCTDSEKNGSETPVKVVFPDCLNTGEGNEGFSG